MSAKSRSGHEPPFDIALATPLATGFDHTSGSPLPPRTKITILSRPTFGVFRAMEGKNDLDAFASALPMMSDLPAALVNALSPEDAMEVMEEIGPFFALAKRKRGGPATR